MFNKGRYVNNRERTAQVPVEDGLARYLHYGFRERAVFHPEGKYLSEHGITVPRGSYVWDLQGMADFLTMTRPPNQRKKNPISKSTVKGILDRLQDRYHVIQYSAVKSQKTKKEITIVTLPHYDFDNEIPSKETTDRTSHRTTHRTDTTSEIPSNDKAFEVPKNALPNERLNGLPRQNNSGINNSGINNSDKDRQTGDPEAWELDPEYQEIRNLSKQAGCPIRSDLKIFKAWQEARKEVNGGKLVSGFLRYLQACKDRGEKGSPAYYLAGHYEQYTREQTPVSSGVYTGSKVQQAIEEAYKRGELGGGLLDEEIEPVKPKRKRQRVEIPLPKAVQAQMDREARGEKTETELVDPETEARLQAKLNRMRGKLEQGMKEGTIGQGR